MKEQENEKIHIVAEKIRQMGREKNPKNIPNLLEYVNDKNGILCYWAICSLVEISNIDAIEPLKKFMETTKDSLSYDKAETAIQEIKYANGMGIFSVEGATNIFKKLLRQALNTVRYPYGEDLKNIPRKRKEKNKQ